MVTRNGHIITTITLTEDLAKDLNAYCQITGLSRSTVIKQALFEYLGKPSRLRSIRRFQEKQQEKQKEEIRYGKYGK